MTKSYGFVCISFNFILYTACCFNENSFYDHIGDLPVWLIRRPGVTLCQRDFNVWNVINPRYFLSIQALNNIETGTQKAIKQKNRFA